VDYGVKLLADCRSMQISQHGMLTL